MVNRHGTSIDRKAQTKAKLVQAVGNLLAREGFQGLGVNKVAKEAGVDKVLVYRYFDGLPGLIGAYSLSKDFWPSVAELVGPDLDRLKSMPPDKQVAQFFKDFIAALRRRPRTLDVLTWELLERNELTKQLEDIRIRTILEYFEHLDEIPEDPNLSAIVVLMAGAVIHLLVKSRINSHVGGIDLGTDAGWERIDSAIDLLLRDIFRK